MIYLVFSSYLAYKDLDELLKKSIHILLSLKNYSNYIDFLYHPKKGKINKSTLYEFGV